MNTYFVRWDYESAFRNKRLVLRAGETIELDAETADFVNRDSPGVLAAPKAETPSETPEETPAEASLEDAEDELRALDAPPQDRQLKGAARRRKDRAGDPSDQGSMTKNDFKAVVNKE